MGVASGESLRGSGRGAERLSVVPVPVPAAVPKSFCAGISARRDGYDDCGGTPRWQCSNGHTSLELECEFVASDISIGGLAPFVFLGIGGKSGTLTS